MPRKPRLSIQERFERFDAANPHVYGLFKRFAWQVKQSGRTRYSADSIVQRMRWFCEFETDEPEFKINDHYTACFARKLMVEDPANFADFFETRATKTERQIRAAQESGCLF